MGNPESESQQGIDELRAILLGDDRQAMDGLREQLNNHASQLQRNDELIKLLGARVGDDEKLREAMGPVLSQVVADLEKSNPRPLARAMSPFIFSSIRSEIANSKEAMVEALYPITGRLVSAAVKNSVASMMESVNRRVDDATSMRVLTARFQSWRTGEPVSAFLIPGPGEVTFHSAMVMERDTGAPICHVDPSGEEAQQEGQSNLVSGLLAALSNLTEEVFTGEDDELRTLDLNGRKITFRRSPCHMLVVEFAGTLSADQHRTIDEKFGEIVSFSDSNDHQSLTVELTSLMHDAPDSNKSDNKPKKTGLWVVLGIFVSAWLVWYVWDSWQQSQLENAAIELQEKIYKNSSLSAYPIEVQVLRESDSLRVTGLIPESYDPLALSIQWQEWVQGYSVETSLAAVADATRSKQLEQDLELLRAENRALRLKTPDNADVLSLHDQLQRIIEGKQILFASDGHIVDDGATSKFLRRIAQLLIAGNFEMQVVGFISEPDGSDDSSERVALILREFGVSSDQLIVSTIVSEGRQAKNNIVILKLRDELP